MVRPVAPNDWRYTDLTKMGDDNLALTQVRDLENGLNQYCIEQGIEFVTAEIKINKTQDNGEYSSEFHFKNNHEENIVATEFPIDLICLAESVNSKNSSAISLQTTIETNESVYFTSFSGKPSGSENGFVGRVFDPSDTTIVLYANRGNETIVNIGTRGKKGEDIDQNVRYEKIQKAQPILNAAGSNINISLKEPTYESGRLDIKLKRALNPIESNVIIIGDAAGSGSPIGALGGSLALSAYPEVVRRLVEDPKFSSKDKSERDALAKEFRTSVAKVVNLRHGALSELMRKLGFYTEKTNQHQLLQGVSSLFLLNDETRRGLITNPRHPAGEAWLRNEFEKIDNNVIDKKSKPPRHVLEYIISGKYPPIESRNPLDVYWEHILLRYIGDVPKDIKRNYSENLKLALIGSNDLILHGHAGITESARILNDLLPTTEYTIVDTVVRCNKDNGWVTEEWGYFDAKTKLQVTDGIDTFQIRNGQIQTKMINYNVVKGTTYEEFLSKVHANTDEEDTKKSDNYLLSTNTVLA